MSEEQSNFKVLIPNQDYSIDNILTIINHLDTSIENKRVLQAQVKSFEQECKNQNPDEAKLRTILNYVYRISKEVALKLFANGLDSGMLKF